MNKNHKNWERKSNKKSVHWTESYMKWHDNDSGMTRSSTKITVSSNKFNEVLTSSNKFRGTLKISDYYVWRKRLLKERGKGNRNGWKLSLRKRKF